MRHFDPVPSLSGVRLRTHRCSELPRGFVVQIVLATCVRFRFFRPQGWSIEVCADEQCARCYLFVVALGLILSTYKRGPVCWLQLGLTDTLIPIAGEANYLKPTVVVKLAKLAQVSLVSNWSKLLAPELRDRLGADVVVNYHVQDIRYLGNDTVEVDFDNLGFQAYGNCRGRSNSLSEIMQIVTSTVRVDVALTLSRRCSLFALPNSCGTLVASVHAAVQSLSVAGTCFLSEQYL